MQCQRNKLKKIIIKWLNKIKDKKNMLLCESILTCEGMNNEKWISFRFLLNYIKIKHMSLETKITNEIIFLNNSFLIFIISLLIIMFVTIKLNNNYLI